jgi:hypothetical protein
VEETAVLNKSDVLESALGECDIILHLFEKLPEDSFDYRPTPGQRSTTELLRYLSFCGFGACYALFDGDWDRFRAEGKRVADAAPETFPAAMERQKQALRAFFDELSDEDFASRDATLPTGVTMSLGKALVEMPLKWLTAYRMQLFLYAKGAGNAELGTINCWAGRDPEPAA